MPGAVLIVLVLVLIGPIAVMLAGVVWTVLVGWLLEDDAEHRFEGQPT